MNNTEKLKTIFCETFEEKINKIDDNASPETIEKWDSMGAVNLMMAIETAFDIEFDLLEISDLKTFGLIKQSLKDKGVIF